MKEALLYNKLPGGEVLCSLCSHRCRIQNGDSGICGVRVNKGGALYTLAYAKAVALNVDPIEKKPLYHYLPGSLSFSIAAAGCNFRCGFCQNWEISQAKPHEDDVLGREVMPEEIISAARKNNCASISYTYTEPTIFFEYALDTARLAHKAGLGNVFVTNGYMTAEAISQIAPFLDAANIDLKFFSDDAYRKHCGGLLQPVCASIETMKKAGIWVEVTTLVIPGENDSDDELTAIADFLASIDRDIPWHISRFHPDYKLIKATYTPPDTLSKAERIGKERGLRYVYCGNIAGWDTDTYCSSCGRSVISRKGMSVLENRLQKGVCAFCGEKTAGVFL